MVYTFKDLVRIEGNPSRAYSAIKEKKYIKISHGVYVDDPKKYKSELEQIFARFPRATLTLRSAFYYLGLSLYDPGKYQIVTPYNSHRIDHYKVEQLYMDDKIINIGRVKEITPNGYIYIYDKERLLIELFRLKTRFKREDYLEIVSSYRKLVAEGKLSIKKLIEYGKYFSNGQRLLEDIQEIILIR